MAVACLGGLIPRECFPLIRKILVNHTNAQPFMEYYVETAMCVMGYKEDALKRMMDRYSVMIDLPFDTLCEKFPRGGTRNHAWSAGPLTIVKRFFPELILKS
jgi:hypothetical protein